MTVATPIEDKRPDERLGSYLARAREARGMTVEDLARVTKLTLANINLIECGDWKAFPVEAYLRSYLNSICGKLNLDAKHVLDWYSAECGSKYASLLADSPAKPTKVKPLNEEEAKPRSMAVPIVIIVLGLAFVVGSHFLKEMGKAEAIVDQPKPAAVEEPVTQDSTEMPEGAEAVPVDSTQADSAAAKRAKPDSTVTQAQVDEAVKKADVPESATIFISSTSTKKDSAVVKPVSNHGKTKFELIGSGEMRTWVGLKRHEEDDSFLREANIANAGTKMVYNASDTLYVVIGEPRAISKLLLNGVETPLPEMKFGRVTRFRVYDGKIF
ncbi:MAG: helix-turn-helix domain-containing protein [Fibrobacter sp.]|nr:helix-turn-helix domain-containing protein [Fibrobacter sp.]